MSITGELFNLGHILYRGRANMDELEDQLEDTVEAVEDEASLELSLLVSEPLEPVDEDRLCCAAYMYYAQVLEKRLPELATLFDMLVAMHRPPEVFFQLRQWLKESCAAGLLICSRRSGRFLLTPSVMDCLFSQMPGEDSQTNGKKVKHER